MRVTQEVAEQNRRTVVETAGRLFRENGYDGIGVAALMKAAGLTHGGFYKQFRDKQNLMEEASAEAMTANRSFWQKALEESDSPPREALANSYLSDTHVKAVGDGCCLAALASEAHRHGPELQTIFGEGLEALAGLIQEKDDEAEALRTISLLVGALVLARAAGDHPVSQCVLTAARASSGPNPPLADRALS